MPARAHATARVTESAPLFAALGDPTRLALVARLAREGPQSIVRLTAVSAVTRQAVTKHLRALEDAGLVASGRRGRERVWALQPRRLAQVRRCLEAISLQWDEAIERLRAMVEED